MTDPQHPAHVTASTARTGIGPFVQAVWRYERGRLPLRMRILQRGVAEIEDGDITGHLVVLAAPPRAPLPPARLDPAHARALEAMGWTDAFVVWPSDDGRRARVIGPARRWAPARWEGMRDVVGHVGGGELCVWVAVGDAAAAALGIVFPGLRERLGLDARTEVLAAAVPEFMAAIAAQEAAPEAGAA